MRSHPLEKLKKTLSGEELGLLEEGIAHERDVVKRKFPFLITITGVIGLVATLYGVEKLIDQTFLINQPWLLLVVGIVILAITGLLYEKL